MSIALWVVTTAIPGMVSVFIRCRLLNRVVGSKYPPLATYFAAFFFDLLYGGINVIFGISTTVLGNTLYFSVGYLFLYSFLFHGSFVKKAFFVVLLECCYVGIFYTLLPLISVLLPIQKYASFVIAYTSVLLWGSLFEFIGCKVKNLKYELPKSFAVYLLFVTAFILITNVTVTELSRAAKGYFPSMLLAIIPSFFALAGTLLIVFAMFTIGRELSHRLSEQSTLMQLENLKEKEDYWQRLASFRHDIKNHMSCLESLMKGGKNEQALSYLDTLTDTIKQLDNRISTGNEFADAIINEKMAVMAEKNIVFTEDISLPEKCRLEPVELCCIFSNTLDNAIEACEQIDGERWIKAEAFIRQSQLIIIIENSIEVPNKSKALPSYSRAERGIGLLNVRTVVEKYGGAMEVSRDKTFVFSAMLPMD